MRIYSKGLTTKPVWAYCGLERNARRNPRSLERGQGKLWQ